MCTAFILGEKGKYIGCSLQQESFSFLKELLINHIEYAVFLWKSRLLSFFLEIPFLPSFQKCYKDSFYNYHGWKL